MRKFSFKSTTSLVLCLSLATPTFAQQAATEAQPFPCASGDGQLVQDGKVFANLLIANLTVPGSEKTTPAPADLAACGSEAVARALVWGGDPLANAMAAAPADLVTQLMPTAEADVSAQADVTSSPDEPAASDAEAAVAAIEGQAVSEDAAEDQAAADTAAAEQATGDQAAADAAAAEQAGADRAAADTAAAEQAGADQAAADTAAAEQAGADQAAADTAAAEQAGAEQAAADAAAAAADQAAADQAAAEAAIAEQNTDSQATNDAPAPDQAQSDQAADATIAGQTEVPAADAAVAPEVNAEEGSTIAADTSAETATPPSDPDTASVPQELTPEQQAAREARRAERQAARQASAAAQAAATEMATADNVVTEEVTKEQVRSANQDFQTSVTGDASTTATADTANTDNGMSNFEKALVLGLGAVAVGAILNNGDQVVSNSGDRVVVQRDGELRVLKNDDVLLRQAGAEVATQTFDDGSTLTVVTRADGSKVTTIRSADGTVLRRSLTQVDGTNVQLIDDLSAADPVEVASLPPVPQEVVTTSSIEMTDQAALEAALTANLLAQTNRTYSLEQVRDIRQVRALAPQVELAAITFETGSAAIQPSQAEQLAALGGAIRQIVQNDPSAVFLIEGHTDAVGDAGYNLALSDRRAETVALALTEYFQVPPENLVTQGYGESILKVKTSTAERANRRAAVRNITALLRQS